MYTEKPIKNKNSNEKGMTVEKRDFILYANAMENLRNFRYVHKIMLITMEVRIFM